MIRVVWVLCLLPEQPKMSGQSPLVKNTQLGKGLQGRMERGVLRKKNSCKVYKSAKMSVSVGSSKKQVLIQS